MTHFFCICLCASLLVAATPARLLAAGDVQVIVPRDKAVWSTDTLVVIGRAPQGVTIPWSVEREGAREQDTVRVDWGDLFEIFVLLTPGLNRVVVKDQRLEVFYNPGDLAPPPGFRPQRIHASDISACDDCHAPVDMELHNQGYPGVCLNCHMVVSMNPKNTQDPQDDPHFQVATADCGKCHEAHTSNDPKLLREDAPTLCGSCHPKRIGGAETHAAYDDGGCSACHDAHYSGFENTLHEPLPGLCHRCHEKGEADGQIHPPVTDGPSCSRCHASHGSGSGLLRATPAELCSECHSQVLELGHGDELSQCSACHDPHGRLGSGLLAGEMTDSCTACHEGLAEGKTVHPALENGCEGCHDPHRNDDLIAARASCADCHGPRKNREFRGLHGNLNLKLGTCTLCHPPHASEHEKLLRGNLHYPVARGNCSSCHGGGEERSVIVEDVAGRCRMCHTFEKDMRATGSRPHDPVAQGDCTSCHDPHMSNWPAFLRGSESETCRGCHEVAEPKGGRDLHPPAESCTECHDPHGGGGAQFLSSRPPELCLDCHDDPRESSAEIHPALEEGCMTCHDPHAGFPPGLMRGDSAYSACQECHEVPELGEGRTFHPPAESCAGCHDPHGGVGPKYLSRVPPELCLDCHDDPREDGREVHPALDQGCLFCHDPHTGFSSAALKSPERDLCLECHDDPAADKNHPHAAVDTCSGCHDPHASDYGHFLRAEGSTLCRRCHDFAEAKEGRALHPPVEDCAECHADSPHGGDAPKFLPNTPPELCLDCHEDPREIGGALHPALEEGCLVCHDPHAGRAPGLLKGEAAHSVCLECHDSPVQGRAQTHAALSKGCSVCHDPHSSANEQFLLSLGNALCGRCHETHSHSHSLDAQLGEKYPGSAEFPRDGAEYACLGCHDAHASNERHLYSRPKEELCLMCHKVGY